MSNARVCVCVCVGEINGQMLILNCGIQVFETKHFLMGVIKELNVKLKWNPLLLAHQDTQRYPIIKENSAHQYPRQYIIMLT